MDHADGYAGRHTYRTWPVSVLETPGRGEPLRRSAAAGYAQLHYHPCDHHCLRYSRYLLYGLSADGLVCADWQCYYYDSPDQEKAYVNRRGALACGLCYTAYRYPGLIGL